MDNDRVPWFFGGLLLLFATGAAVWLLCSLRLVPPRLGYGWHTEASIPQSPQQVAALLTKMNVRVAMLRPRENEGDRAEMTAISARLYQLAVKHPEIAEVWKTAARVINMRSGSDSTRGASICGSTPSTMPNDGVPDKFESLALVSYRNCEISLDGDDFVMARNRRAAIKNPKDAMLELNNVHVIYRGGHFPRVTMFTCTECTFEIRLQEIPPPRGRSFIRGLLFSDFNNLSIGISGSSS